MARALSDRELMAIAGHETAKETSRYTKKRDRDALADAGMSKVAKALVGHHSGPLKEVVLFRLSEGGPKEQRIPKKSNS